MNFRDIFSNKEFIFTGRVLLQAAKSPQAYIARTVLAFFLLIVLSSFADSRIFSGKMAFQILVTLNFIYMSLYSCIVFSSIIASEKENGTLGLLMLTPRHPLSLIAAKSVPVFTEIINCLLLQLPIFIMCIAHGGVDSQQIPQIMLLLIFQVLLLGSFGIFFSCLGISFKNTIGATIICGLLYFFGPGLLDLFQMYYLPNSPRWNLMHKSAVYNNVLQVAEVLQYKNIHRRPISSKILASS